MKEIKKFLVYYNESRGLIGFREHHFDWEEGDVITTDGVRTTIFGIFDGTEKNLKLASKMIDTLRRYLPKKKWIYVIDKGIKLTGDWFEDALNIMENSHYELVDVRTKVWKSFDAELDFVDEVMSEMEVVNA